MNNFKFSGHQTVKLPVSINFCYFLHYFRAIYQTPLILDAEFICSIYLAKFSVIPDTER